MDEEMKEIGEEMEEVDDVMQGDEENVLVEQRKNGKNEERRREMGF